MKPRLNPFLSHIIGVNSLFCFLRYSFIRESRIGRILRGNMQEL